MSFQDLVTKAQTYFPDFQVKYKNESSLMKLIGKIMFFNKGFMTDYTTTIGSTVYFPTETITKVRPVSAAAVLLHELIHVSDAKKYTKVLFGFLYLSPQLWALLCLPLFFLSWKLSLPLFLLFLSPVPAFFRMHFEKRAYLTSLYAISKLGIRLNFNSLLATQAKGYVSHFKDSSYYFMWPFGNIQKEFDEAIIKVKAGNRPFEDSVFDMIDDLINVV